MSFTKIPLSTPPFLTYISVLFVWEVALEIEYNKSEMVKRQRHTYIRQRDRGMEINFGP